MELNKNYPWLSDLKVSSQVVQKWQEENPQESLTFWALRHKNIDQKSYFNWAVDHYQIPFLQDIFFEQNLMTKRQWNEIKDLFDWTEEILPVAFWNGTVFIGCVEPPKKEIKVLGFDTRFILTSYQSLGIIWKLIQSLSLFIEKEATQSRIVNSLELEKQDLLTQNPLDKPVVKDSVLSPDVPSQKPLDKPIGKEPVLKVESVLSPDMPSQKPLDKPVNFKPVVNLKEQTSFPESEDERIGEDNNTFPGRSPIEDDVLVMKNIEKKNNEHIDKEEDSPDVGERTHVTFFGAVDKTMTHFSHNYEELWKYTKTFYCTSLILKVKGERVYPVNWTGQIKCQRTGDIFVDLNDYSLFKIVKKGYSYNGFVVDNPVNKKFFSQIGWSEYPRHVTAIPIKDSEQRLINVFVGFSLEPISSGKIRQIQESVLKFFQDDQKTLKKAA
ncbi:MAG: hypothetical protein OXN83_00745 [Oligoflexia bacterium]|nr:hypothetical protein [Oligoflexia bacterium]